MGSLFSSAVNLSLFYWGLIYILSESEKNSLLRVTGFASRGRKASKENENGKSLLFINRYERQAEWGEYEETQRDSQFPEAEGGEVTTGETGTQFWAQTKGTFGNLEVAERELSWEI